VQKKGRISGAFSLFFNRILFPILFRHCEAGDRRNPMNVFVIAGIRQPVTFRHPIRQLKKHLNTTDL
jgi:hypothetical protein